MPNNLKHGLGYLPDVANIHDYTHSHDQVAPMLAKTRIGTRLGPARAAGALSGAAAAPAPALDPQVDLRPDFPDIVDQGQLGSCTANAGVALVGYFERKAMGRSIDPSRLFLYKVTRDILGWTADTGAFLRTTMQALAMFGVPPENYWPYDGNPSNANSHYDVEPTPFCYSFAKNYSAVKYLRLDPPTATPAEVLQNIRTNLAGGFPSIFGFPVHPEFDNPTDGKVAFPGPNSPMRGGHAITAVGYDDKMMIGADQGALLVRNSWGISWGLDGYAYMSYRYVTEGLANDWWTVIKQEWVDTGLFS